MAAGEPRLTVALTFDHDAISSEVDRGDGPALRSRGEFGSRVGAPRILDLLEREAIASTWFIPGHTIVTFPDSVAAIVAGGHEIACHGWAHEDLAGLDGDAERSVLERSAEAVARASGVPPRGFRAPYWSLSEQAALRARRARGVGPMSAPSKVEEIWTGELRYAWEREPGGLLTITMHPEAIGATTGCSCSSGSSRPPVRSTGSSSTGSTGSSDAGSRSTRCRAAASGPQPGRRRPATGMRPGTLRATPGPTGSVPPACSRIASSSAGSGRAR
jgi:peptidoglycan/xylan/chitin deacetylase (PgdA/CDA1 family)